MNAQRKQKPIQRYTLAQKQMVLTYIRIRGYGGIMAAEKEFGVSVTSIYRWKEKDRSKENHHRVRRGNATKWAPFNDEQSINGQDLS